MAAVVPANGGGDGVPVEDGLELALHFLGNALDVLDSMNAPAELGARVQHALDSVAETVAARSHLQSRNR